MIGVFDSGLGGLTVLRSLTAKFPTISFTYLGDHANVPYGERRSDEIVDLTRSGVEALFSLGCKLVLLGCNTATAVAARRLQTAWLPTSPWRAQGHNILGIVAPTVEAATQTPWAVTTPQHPQKNLTDRIVVFGTTRTIASGVYAEEIRKRCPNVTVVEQPCPKLAGAIEQEASQSTLYELVSAGVENALRQCDGAIPNRAILGCTHFPLVEALFQHHLPQDTRILSQPDIVAFSLEDYLRRHPEYEGGCAPQALRLLTTGTPNEVSARAQVFWKEGTKFAHVTEF